MIFDRVSSQDILFLTKHLAVMMKSGVPLADAWTVLYDQAKSPTLRKIITAIQKDILNGQSLGSALAKHPQAFDTLYCTLIDASEKSGTLEKNLEFLAGQLGKSQSLKKKIQNAMLYPSLVFIATFGMGGFVSLVILPQLVDFFKTLGTDLPLSTQILLGFAALMRDYGGGIVIGGIVFFVCTSLLVRTRMVKPIWHRILLKIPLLGRFLQYAELARFSRNLGILLASGVPIIDALTTTAKTLSNATYQSHLLAVTKKLQSGKSIGVTLAEQRYSEYPPLVSRMITIGEKTGRLDETLLYLGDFYEEEIDAFSKNVTTLLEPLLLLTIGLIVGFVAIAIIGPIYELTGSLRR